MLVGGRQLRSFGTVPTAATIALFLASRASVGQDQSAIPAFPAQANAITADVVVLDKQDRPVRGLMRGDFTLLEDGKPQAIVAFEARDVAMAAPQSEATVTEERVATNEGQVTRGGRTFAFLLDDLGTDPLSMEDVKKAIVRWMGERADPRDEVTLTTSSGRVWWSDRIGRGREDLVAVLGRVKGGRLRDEVTDWEAYQIVNFDSSRGAAEESTGTTTGRAPGRAPANPHLIGGILDRVASRLPALANHKGFAEAVAAKHYLDFTRRLRALLGATERLSRGLAGARGRKAIVIFSGGFLYDVNQRELFDRSIDASQRANTAIYFVGAGGLELGLGAAGIDEGSWPGECRVRRTSWFGRTR